MKKTSQILKITKKKQLKCKTEYLKEKKKTNKQKEPNNHRDTNLHTAARIISKLSVKPLGR